MLQLKHKNSEKRPLWLVDAKYTVGSDIACDIQLEDDSVAPQQAELIVSPESVILHNLGEPEAVSVNGELLSQSRPLAHGDEVVIGSTSFELIDPKLARAAGGSGQQEAVSAADIASSGWSLRATNTALANKSFPVDREVVIGRSAECDITLGVAHLSRRHARLFFSGNQMEVEDLRSSNGTYVNGKQVQRSLLRDGDELSFDTLTFKVIGPQDDSDSTMMRPQRDIDKTNVRPAIKVGDPKLNVAKTPRTPNKSGAKPSNVGQRTQSYTPEKADEGKKMNGVVIGVIVVVLIAAVYWLFLS